MDSAKLIDKIKQKINQSYLPSDVLEKANTEITRAEVLLKSPNFSLEADRHLSYVDFLTDLPWEKQSQDILDLNRARQILDKNHFGLSNVKERIIEYLSILILNKRKNQSFHSGSLAFVGLVGSGKTSLAYSIAESLGRPIIRIPFGGLGGASQLRGESRIKSEAQPGLILNALKKAKVINPVILLDELDRVVTEVRGDIMGVLVEVLDPQQNIAFLDHYLELPFDLSKVLFIGTANNTNNISTAVLDRLELIEMPFYSDEQKISIGKNYLLPQELQRAGLEVGVIRIDENLWPEIVRPLGFDGGIRSLKRAIEGMVRKIAVEVVQGKLGPFSINHQNLGMYLSK